MGRLTGSDGSGEVRALELRPALYCGDVGAGTAALGGSASPEDASVVRDAGGTTLRFTRRLDAADLPPGAVAVAALTADSYMNWAYGSTDEIGYQGISHRGSWTQEFQPGAPSAAPATAAHSAAPQQPRRRKPQLASPARLRTHERLMLIAWSGLLPLGAVLGRLVQLAPHSLRVHILVQVAGLACVGRFPPVNLTASSSRPVKLTTCGVNLTVQGVSG